MADDLRLPQLRWDPSFDSSSTSDPRPKKRVRLSPLPSSDPPIFSSDDDPSVENYTQNRRKKQFRGPWYRQQATVENAYARSPRKKRVFERQYDSGVYMMSDDTEMDEGAPSNTEELQAVSNVPLCLPMRNWSSSQIIEESPSPEDLVRQHVGSCLENGHEIIDLSGRNLTTLSNATLEPLLTFTRIPLVNEGVFEHLEPTMKLFLTSNKLKALPEALFNLSHLSVLSLRANKIQEIPPAIGRLTSLTELNVAQNNLQHLPFEILNLFSEDSKLMSFQIHPNPFHAAQLPKDEDQVTGNKFPFNGIGRRQRRGALAYPLPGENFHPKWRLSYKARTEVRFLDSDGSHLKGPKFSAHTLFGPEKFPNGLPIAAADYTPKPPSARGNPVSRVPSLLECALQACSKTTELPYLAKQLPEDCPSTFPTLLANVAAKRDAGGTKCTVCSRNFLIARTEWIEWWVIERAVLANIGILSAASPLRSMENERDIKERMVPLIRRGCSWLCVPEKLEKEDAKEDEMEV